jgi:hypothetical protein
MTIEMFGGALDGLIHEIDEEVFDIAGMPDMLGLIPDQGNNAYIYWYKVRVDWSGADFYKREDRRPPHDPFDDEWTIEGPYKEG